MIPHFNIVETFAATAFIYFKFNVDIIQVSPTKSRFRDIPDSIYCTVILHDGFYPKN